ncbi:MAG: TlpA disulfide reductase family protein [Sphingobacteriaceae bacterium]|nr:TlpA disulfide reductase family protein [Sphingobacteriaceae bacterium]
MRSLFLLLLLSTSVLQAQNIPIIKQADLYALLAKRDDTLRVVNFWATWCGPCVQELPHFEKLQRNHHDKPLKVILVSLDFPSQLQKRVVPFVKKRKLTATVLLLDGGDPNQWIDRVEPRWSGSIPATLFLYKGKRLFYEGQLSEADLYKYVQQIKSQSP